jgi:RNA ligase (TIGR02306 family)
MPSDCIVPVVEVRNIREHPNASLLSIVEVLGYQMVTGLVEDPEGPMVRYFVKGERDERGRRIPVEEGVATDSERSEAVRYNFRYKEKDRAVYFPADTVLTDEWAKEFEVDHLLKTGNRVGRARLRGEPSFGLVVEIPEGQNWKLGDNVADYFDATKWQPDPDQETAPDAAPYDSEIDPHFVKYTDIQNGLLLYDKFREGEEVVATEKLHGKNCRVGLVNGTLCVGSRTTRKDPEKLRNKSIFWPVADDPKVINLLEAVRREKNAKVVILFGEVYGQGVQSLHYGCKKQKGFRAFDIYADGNYFDYSRFKLFCDKYLVETVPLVYRGPFSLEKIKEASVGRSILPGADNIREGVVVRPVVERRDPALGRVCLKFVSTEYDLSKHKKKDTVDV